MAPTLELALHEDAREVVVRMGPFMPSNAEEAPKGQLARFTWPVDGWLHGFHVRLVNVEGNDVPRDILRDLVAINFDREQVIRPELERLSGVGSETHEKDLTQDLSVPLVTGQRVALYASLHDDTGRVPVAYVLVTIAYTPPEDAKDRTPVFDPTFRIAALGGSFQGPPR